MEVTKRISYLDGIRGFAALQVVLVHYLLFFLPYQRCSLFWTCWAQNLRDYYSFFPIDGYMAVSLFFILSGYVLTKSFAKTYSSPINNIFKRWVRLQIPVAAVLVISYILYFFCSDAFMQAAQLNNSASWTKDFFTIPPTLLSLEKEIFPVSLISGYQNISIWASSGYNFFDAGQSLDVPLWSLNIEFWGSIVIIFLAWIKPYKSFYELSVLILCCLFFVHSLILFMIGHILASKEKTYNNNRIGFALLIIGILLSTWREDLIPRNIFYEFDSLFFFMAQSNFHYVGMVAAIFIFLGIYLSPLLRSFFTLKPWQKLGRVSFALYLLHFPILLTLTPLLQLRFFMFFGYEVSAIAAFVLGISITYVSAVYFTRWVDDPAIKWSRLVERKV